MDNNQTEKNKNEMPKKDAPKNEMPQNDKPFNPSRSIIILSLLIAAISAYILLTVDLADKPMAGRGGIDENAMAGSIGGDFKLTDYNGDNFSSDQLKGKLSLVYFGFTYCPDICPTSLQKISKVLAVLDKYNMDVTPVFITIDPQRDKIKTLKEYLAHFNNKIIGLTGTPDEIAQVAEKFKVYYAKSESPNLNEAGDNYMVDHSSFIYLMDKDFRYMKHFYMDSPPEEIIEQIRINQ